LCTFVMYLVILCGSRIYVLPLRITKVPIAIGISKVPKGLLRQPYSDVTTTFAFFLLSSNITKETITTITNR